jgi:hypothetical protein
LAAKNKYESALNNLLRARIPMCERNFRLWMQTPEAAFRGDKNKISVKGFA